MNKNHPDYHYLVNQIPRLDDVTKARFARLAGQNFQRVSDRLKQLVTEDVEAHYVEEDELVPAVA